MTHLSRLHIRGYKSIADADIPLNRISVLIGANGSGKSNLLSFIDLLQSIADERLALRVARGGGASAHLRFGPKVTPVLEVEALFETETDRHAYRFSLEHAPGDRFIFAHEAVGVAAREPGDQTVHMRSLGSGHTEGLLQKARREGDEAAGGILAILGSLNQYHFHDTTWAARVHQRCSAADNRYLLWDAGNLAAVLHRYRDEEPERYRQLIETVRIAAPFFDDFVLEPEGHPEPTLLVQWRQRGSDVTLGSYALSDGTLRFIALVTALLQHPDRMPKVAMIDEPELGLHPHAIAVLSELVQSASRRTQFILATQSPLLVDCFAPEDIVVVSQGERGSTFTRLEPARLRHWLEAYSVGELWEKNVIGGGPL